ncbi:pyridoxamine 5'-phosphate oxidase family protein, partial [Pseudomonas sp. MOB-449]|nr:pyridoxamine 5'-phosphate oxidase family protein [Pseudomonas sp. MOB-449]
LDTLSNIIANPVVGLLFIVPGFDDTLRVNGRATLSNDPEILKLMSIADRTPKLAIVVKVDEVFMHCAKAFRRSHLWDPAHFQ